MPRPGPSVVHLSALHRFMEYERSRVMRFHSIAQMHRTVLYRSLGLGHILICVDVGFTGVSALRHGVTLIELSMLNVLNMLNVQTESFSQPSYTWNSEKNNAGSFRPSSAKYCSERLQLKTPDICRPPPHSTSLEFPFPSSFNSTHLSQLSHSVPSPCQLKSNPPSRNTTTYLLYLFTNPIIALFTSSGCVALRK
jgi:hypothetical protein